MSLTWPVIWHDSIDSTNDEAKRQAASGALGGLWIAAKSQTIGRGRLGRTWVSPAGNLFCTAVFAEAGGIRTAMRVPFAAALAVSDTVLAYAPSCDVRLKWPNDVRVGGDKMSGILVESGETDGQFWVAVGIGINVAIAPDAGQGATCLADLTQVPVDAAATLDTLRGAFATRLIQARDSFADTRADWLKRAEALGQMVRVSPGGDVIEGVFEDMAEDGGLILRLPDGGQRIIRAGDVELVRQT